MAEIKPTRISARLDALGSALEQKLENEHGILDLLVAAHARGQAVDPSWEKLHAAAARDERLAELAFAYERLTGDRRIKTMPAAVQAKLLHHAGIFFSDIFADLPGAEGYLERALALVPTDTAVFDKLEGLLVARHDGLRLSELYSNAALHRSTKEEQLSLLRRAAELVDGFSGAQDRAIKLYTDILKLDPSDANARHNVAERYAAAGRHQDLARLLEQTLLIEGASSGEAGIGVRDKLVALYANKLGEVERALPHVEEILRVDPGHKLARDVADKLLSHKAVAARVAAALDAVHERLGNPQESARMLGIQIEQLRGPKRLEAQKRLALLHTKYAGELGDRQKTYALHEAIVALDPADDAVRKRYLALAYELDKRLDATRVLGRAASGSKDAGARARMGVEVAELHVSLGDAKRSRAAYSAVLEAGGDDDAVVAAAHAMERIATEAHDQAGLAAVLARLADVEPDEPARLAATQRLAELCEELRDQAGAISAYKRLVGTAGEGVALIALERLLEAAGAQAELAVVLRRRSAREPDRAVARALSLRAAEIRSKIGDRAAALEAWRAFVTTFGPSREAFVRLVPLLEQERAWGELAGAIEADAGLAPPSERAPILARLGQLRASRLDDAAGALAAYARALAADPAEKASRAAVERLLVAGDLRIAAADVLEPIARAEKSAALLARVLETRGDAAERVSERLAALGDAAGVAAEGLKDPKRALDLAGKGLALALASSPKEATSWLARVDAFAAAASDPVRTAAVLKQALGDRPVDSDAAARTARKAGEALVASGDVAGALSVYRAALAFEPSSAELLARVDTLLREQGNPDERLALYRAALEQPCDPARRREILHAIGGIERRDKGDARAAAATYRRALDEDPTDRAAFEALTEIHEGEGDWGALYAELERALARASAEDRTPLLLRMAVVARSADDATCAAEHYTEILASNVAVADEALAAMQTLAEELDATSLLFSVFERRVAGASEPLDEAAWLEKLAELEHARLARPEEALAHVRRAAERALAGLDPVLGERLFERVLTLAPDDLDAASRLVALYRDRGALEPLARVYPVLIRATSDRAAAVERLLAFEGVALKARTLASFVAEADALLASEPSPEHRLAIRAARARALASDPATADLASVAYREMVQAGDPEAASAFEAFLAPRGAEANDDKRWLWAFRAERAVELEHVKILVAWAQFEEVVARDPARAAELYGRVLDVDAEHDEALGARSRLLRDLGDLEGAAAALASRRDRSEGAARVALELELGELLLDRIGRADDALDAVVDVLEAQPGEPTALKLVERALPRPETALRAARMLEKAADAVDDAALSTSLIEVLLATPSQSPEVIALRRGWFLRLLDREGRPPAEGLELALRAVRELPLDASLWDRAERLGRTLGAPELVAEAYRREIARFAEQRPLDAGDALEEVCRRAVEFLEEWFDDPEAVVVLLRRVVEIVPSSAWAFERLKLVYNLGERWDELFTLYDAVIGRAPDEAARADMLEDAAFAAKDLAGDAPRATSYFEALLPYRREARIQAALERLYERQGKHRELIVLLTPDLGELSGEAAMRLRSRLAELWLDGVDDPTSALELAVPLLGSEAHAKDALDLFERILRAACEPSRRQAERATSRRAAELLSERYRVEGRHADLARVIAIELEATDDPSERAARLRVLIDLKQRELGDPAGAFDALGELVLIEPEDAASRGTLIALGERLGRHARLGDVLALAAEKTPPPLRTELFSLAAAIFERDVGDLDRAIALARSVLGSAQTVPEASLSAARELDRLLARAGRAVERCDVLDRLAELEPEPGARRAALVELGGIAINEAKDPERAVRAYRGALAIGPDVAARDGLVIALELAGRVEELVELLGERATALESIAARRDRVRVAELWEAPLDRLDRAIDAWRDVRTHHGKDVESAEALAKLLERAERWDDLIELLEDEAGRADDPARAADLWRRLGDLHREHTLRWADAVACYELALEARASDPGARRGLEALAFRFDLAAPEQMGVIAGAVAAIVRVARADGDDSALVALLEPRVAVAPNEEAKAAVLVETSQIFEGRGDASAAFDTSFRALAAWPTAELAAEAARLATLAERWSTIADGLAALDAREGTPTRAIRLLAQGVARWHADRGALEPAERAIERALAREPHDVELLESLAALERRAPSRALVLTLLRIAEAKQGDLDALREAALVAIDPVADRALAKTIAEKLLDAAESRWLGADAAGAATETEMHTASEGSGLGRFASPSEAAAFALDLLARLVHEEAPARLVDLFLRGARLPFDGGERRRLRLRAAEFADKDQTIAIYEQLFSEDPNDELATERLESLYRSEGKRAELLVMRERQIAVASSPDRRVDLRFELATLLASGGEAAQALAALRENVQQAPGHAPSTVKFAELLEAGGHHEELADHTEKQAARAIESGDFNSAASLFARAATIAETRLGDSERAIVDHARAAELGRTESLDALARLYTRQGDHAAAALHLERLLERSARDAAPDVALRLTDALVSAGQAENARVRLARAVTDLDAAPLRARLATLHRDAGDYRALAALLAEDAMRAPDRATRATLLADAAELYVDKCADPEAAIPLLAQAREMAPDELAPKLALASALAASGRLDEAARSLQEIITGYGGRRPKERALVHFGLARVSLVAGDRPRALGELDVALRIDPAHPEILHALARLAFEEGQLERANRTYRALLLVVRRPRDERRNEPPSSVSRAEVLLELSEISELTGDGARGAEYLASALEAARETSDERDRLFRALRARGRNEILARALEDRVAALEGSPELASALGELAELYEGPLGRSERALAARLRAMTLVPDSVPTRDAALDLGRRTGQIEACIEALAGLVEAAPSQDKAVSRRLALARTLEIDLKDDRRAAEAYARAEADLRPGDARLAEVFRALERVHERLGDREAQAAVIGKRIEASEGLGPEDRADPIYRLAALRIGDDATQADAFDLLERALAVARDADRASAILRAALDRTPDSARLLRFYERFARDGGDKRALVDVLLALGDRAVRGVIALSPGEDPFREAVDVALALDDRKLAEVILRRVLEREGAPDGAAWAMIALAHLAEDAGNLAEAVALRERAAPHFDPEEERVLLLSVAVAAAGPLSDLDRAARIYEALRVREPADPELWRPLSDVYRRRGDQDRLAALLEETRPLVDDPIERAAMGFERAKIVVRRDGALAMSLLRDVLEDDPTQVEAAMLLSTMLEKEGKSDELAELLARQLEAAKDREDVASIVSISLRLGALLENRGEGHAASDIYHAALDWDKGAREVLRAVLRLAFERDDSMDLGDALEQMLAVEVGKEAEELAIQLAGLRAGHGDPLGAEAALEQGFAAVPTSARLREELAARYTSREAWSKLAQLQIREADAMEEPRAKVAALRRAADVLHQRAGDARGAADVLRRALEVDPKERDVLTALLDAYAALAEHDLATEAVSRALEVDPDDAWLYRARASLHDAKGKSQLALLDLERAYEKSGGSYATELVQQLDRAIAWCTESGTADARMAERGLRLRAAEVLHAAGDTERARAHLADLVRRDAKDKIALRRLAELESRAERWDAASATYRRLLALEDGEVLVEVALKLADACERDGRLADARGGLERALRAAPGDALVRTRLRNVYNATGASRELAQMILEDAAAAPDVAGRFTHLLHAGRLLLDSDTEADHAQATSVLETARGLRPEEAEATLLLADAYAFLGRRAEARALLDGLIASQKGRRSRQLGPVYRRVARLYREEGDANAAFAALLRAFENDSQTGSLAMELGRAAMERGDFDIAQRAFRTITMMKLGQPGTSDGTTQSARSSAYLELGRIANMQGDRRKARLMVEKAVSEDPTNETARALFDELRTGG